MEQGQLNWVLITSTLHLPALQFGLSQSNPGHGLVIGPSDRMAWKGRVGACRNRRI
jgi:hypothetical protein